MPLLAAIPPRPLPLLLPTHLLSWGLWAGARPLTLSTLPRSLASLPGSPLASSGPFLRLLQVSFNVFKITFDGTLVSLCF